ncbi:hypothetical protein Tco_0709806 [Tanacetum coccineum]
MEKYCLGNAIKELKEEFWNHVMIRADVDKYITRFHELARLLLQLEEQWKPARVRSFSIAAKEAQQDLNVMTKTNKIVRGCGLELECHTFIIDSIPFGHGSFDVIVGMDWLSRPRAKIVCYDKIVQIPLFNEENLEVHGERPEGNLKQLKIMQVNKLKLKDIPVVRNFPGVFSEDLSRLPPSREVEFPIDLIPEATPIAKSPYRLASTEMQELSNQLKEIQEKKRGARSLPKVDIGVAYKREIVLEIFKMRILATRDGKLWKTIHQRDCSKARVPVSIISDRDKEVKIDDKLHFVEKPMEIIDREVKKLKKSRIPIVKVRWNPRRGPKLTWEREDEMKRKYPQLFASAMA